MVKIVDEIVMQKVGGGGRATVDYAQKFILNEDFLKMMAKLKVRTEKTMEGKRHVYGGTITLTKEDLPEYFQTGEEGMNGAAHKFNQVFVAMESPFYATSLTSEEAKKVKVEKTKTRGANIGEKYIVTIPDQLAVYRISDTFSPDFYACEGSKKTLTTEQGGEGSGAYQEPPEELREYVAKWIEDNGADNLNSLKVIGMDITEV